MKPDLLVPTLAVAATAFLSAIAGASPNAHARQHKPTVAKSSRRPGSVKRPRPLGRAYILHGTIPDGDPSRLDSMAVGKGIHPERMDRMNVVKPVPPAPKP